MKEDLEALSQLPDRISFSKLSGSGNDFIALDNRTGTFSDCAPELARRVCSRRYSVGADGMILVENSNKASVRIRYFNPDGGEFSTCGNGGRCAARFALLSVITGRKMTLETNAGVIDAEVLANNSVRLRFVDPMRIQLRVPISFGEKTIHGHSVLLGDPHFVLFGRDIRKHKIVPFARKVRYHTAFAPEGTNVNFIELLSRHNVKIRTYERGVEDETLACGSGCVSAALALHASGLAESPITFEPQSRIPLIVHFQKNETYHDILLEGDARLIYRGELIREGILGFPVNF